jgi:hypothetical protein
MWFPIWARQFPFPFPVACQIKNPPPHTQQRFGISGQIFIHTMIAVFNKKNNKFSTKHRFENAAGLLLYLICGLFSKL